MKSILTYLLFFLISSSAFSQVKRSEIADQLVGIDSLLNKILKDQNAAGFAVAVVKGDEVIYSKGFGYR